MQGVIVHPGPIGKAVRAAPARALIPPGRLGEVIRPSATLSPVERVGVYHGMYLWRMRDALAADYPALEHFLGDDGFTALVRDYVAAFPSRSYTLNRLGNHLPAFVRKRARGIRHRAFCHDLARLELAVTEVFDAEETAALTEAAVAAVPAAAWDRARLRPIAAFRLLSLRYPVNAYLESVHKDNHDHPKARRQDSWVAIYRRNYGVYRHDLSRPAYDLLVDLSKGRPLGRALAAALRRGGKTPTEGQLFEWFRDWVGIGLFSSVVEHGQAARDAARRPSARRRDRVAGRTEPPVSRSPRPRAG
jgi:hypothetical protein